jgi:succinoglycan biosynthesis protein ExoA
MTRSDADILIVIPCLNEAAHLPGLLAGLLRDTTDARIVVADGGSKDGSREIVARLAVDNPRIVLLDNPARLQSAGINLAAKTYGDTARWLVRVDAHCTYPDNYVGGLIDSAGAHDATSVVVPMVSRGKACFQIAAATAQNSRLGTGGSPHRHVGQGAFVDHGHHALMDLSLFRQVGGYREDMSHNEDAELDMRLAKAGGRIWLEPRLALQYYPRGTVGSLWRQYWNYGRGRAQTLILHDKKPKLRQTLPLAVPLAGLCALLTPVHWVFAVPLLVWMATCLIAGAVIGARQDGFCAMASGVAAMTMHMAWGLGFLRRTLIRN